MGKSAQGALSGSRATSSSVTANSSKCPGKDACLTIERVVFESPMTKSAASMVQNDVRCHDWNRPWSAVEVVAHSRRKNVFVREILKANSGSRAASQGGSRGETGWNDLDALSGDPRSHFRFTRTSRDCGLSGDNRCPLLLKRESVTCYGLCGRWFVRAYGVPGLRRATRSLSTFSI